MAIILPDRSKCALCERVLATGQRLVLTSHFISDRADHLWRFSDAGMHYDCFQTWQHREEFVRKFNDTVSPFVAGNGTRHRMRDDGIIAVVAVPEAQPGDVPAGFWSDEIDANAGPPLTDAMVQAAERDLGYRLPETYVRLLRMRNGGRPRCCCFPTSVRTSWAQDHIRIVTLMGVGFERGIDAELGSRYLVQEWGYPDVGIIVADTPSGGHDMVMLDYSECGPRGEPRVIHVETECNEPEVTIIAPHFAAFARGLRSCSSYDT